VPDALFADPRLAPLYDAFDAPEPGVRPDLVAYLALAEEFGARRVLDVGCGTGNLALLLAGRGLAVTGVDPAAASLAVAAAKDPAGRVSWVHGDAAAVAGLGADLAVMTGNVAQVFLSDADWAAALRGVHGALRPGGAFVFETRRPEARAWEQWAVQRPAETAAGVERRFALTEVRPPLVSFRYTYRFLGTGEVITSDSTLRFRSREELAASLADGGFVVHDVREAPDRPGLEYVFVAGRVP
jgi:SAM-dependent methyltransferase